VEYVLLKMEYVRDASTVKTLPFAFPSITMVARRVRCADESAKTLFKDFSPTEEMTLGEDVKALAAAKRVAR